MAPKKATPREAAPVVEEVAPEPVDEVDEHQASPWLVLTEEQYAQLSTATSEQLTE